MDHNMRNPVLGVHVPMESYKTPHCKTTREIVDEANNSVPHLRSLAAMRPHEED